jgi:hypothetical protein
MAAVDPEEPTPQQLGETSAELGREIAKLRAEMKRALDVAGMRNDPALPLVSVLASSLDAQWRLHNQAVRYFRSTSERLDRQYVETMAQAEAALDLKRLSVVEGLVPQLAQTVTRSVEVWNRAVTARTMLLVSGLAVAVVIAAGCLAYASGYEAGKDKAMNLMAVVPAAMKQNGPDAAMAIGELARYNDLGYLMKDCRKNAFMAEGRQACSLSFWLDPSKPAPQPKGGG